MSDEYAYFVPFFNGVKYGNKVVKVHIHDFDVANVSVIDLSKISQEVAGFFGGFSYRTAAGLNYGFLVPHRNVQGPVDGMNTEFTADGFTGEQVNLGRSAYGGDHLAAGYHGNVVRIDLDKFNVSGVTVLDLTKYEFLSPP